MVKLRLVPELVAYTGPVMCFLVYQEVLAGCVVTKALLRFACLHAAAVQAAGTFYTDVVHAYPANPSNLFAPVSAMSAPGPGLQGTPEELLASWLVVGSPACGGTEGQAQWDLLRLLCARFSACVKANSAEGPLDAAAKVMADHAACTLVTVLARLIYKHHNITMVPSDVANSAAPLAWAVSLLPTLPPGVVMPLYVARLVYACVHAPGLTPDAVACLFAACVELGLPLAQAAGTVGVVLSDEDRLALALCARSVGVLVRSELSTHSGLSLMEAQDHLLLCPAYSKDLWLVLEFLAKASAYLLRTCGLPAASRGKIVESVLGCTSLLKRDRLPDCFQRVVPEALQALLCAVHAEALPFV